MARDHFANFQTVISDSPPLAYSNWTVLGPREDVQALMVGFASLYCDGLYISFADLEQVKEEFARRVIRSVAVSPAIQRDWQSRLESAPKSLAGPSQIESHRQTWLRLASSLGLPQVMMLVGRRVIDAQTTATLYCGPTFDPSKQLNELQEAARIASRKTPQQRRS